MTGTLDDETLQQERKYLYYYALMRLRDADLAEDAVQETLVAAVNTFASYQGRSSLRTWLVAILRNKIADLARARARTHEVQIEPGDGEEVSEDDLDALFSRNGHWDEHARPHAWGDPRAALEQQQFWAVMDVCMKRLPERIAEVFYLREVMGESIEDICKTVEITATNCSVMLFRARAQLRACLETKWFAGADHS